MANSGIPGGRGPNSVTEFVTPQFVDQIGYDDGEDWYPAMLPFMVGIAASCIPLIGQAAGSGGETGLAIAPVDEQAFIPSLPPPGKEPHLVATLVLDDLSFVVDLDVGVPVQPAPVPPTLQLVLGDDDWKPVVEGDVWSASQPPTITPTLQATVADDDLPAPPFVPPDDSFVVQVIAPLPIIGQAAGSDGETGQVLTVIGDEDYYQAPYVIPAATVIRNGGPEDEYPSTFLLDDSAEIYGLPQWGPQGTMAVSIWAYSEDFQTPLLGDDDYRTPQPALVAPIIAPVWPDDEYPTPPTPFGLEEYSDYRPWSPAVPVPPKAVTADDEWPTPAAAFALDDGDVYGLPTWGPQGTVNITIWAYSELFQTPIEEDAYLPPLPATPRIPFPVIEDPEWCPFIAPPVGNPDEDYWQPPYIPDASINWAAQQTLLLGADETTRPIPTVTSGGRKPRIHFSEPIQCRIEATGTPGHAEATANVATVVHRVTLSGIGSTGQARIVALQHSIPSDEDEEMLFLLQMLMEDDEE